MDNATRRHAVLLRAAAGPLLAGAAEPFVGEAAVVAPDPGAVKLAHQYSRLLNVPLDFVHKARLSGHEVETHGVTGDVRNRTPSIVDDMLSTGGTIAAAVAALGRAGALEPISVAVTHALLVGRAHDVLRPLPIARLIVGNTVAVDQTGDLPVAVTALRRSLRQRFDATIATSR
jgi:ribose-phosphate pyrophosphokinase